MQNKKIEVILKIAFFLACVLPAILVAFAIGREMIRASRIEKCQNNLVQLVIAGHLYKQDFGRNVRSPDRNGAGFLTKLYQVGYIKDYQIFLCPNTYDKNNKGSDLLDITGTDQYNSVSYSGRRNKTQFTYPGIFKENGCEPGTSIAADDLQGTKNHEGVFNFLFHDGHVELMKVDDLENRRFEELYDPLTN